MPDGRFVLIRMDMAYDAMVRAGSFYDRNKIIMIEEGDLPRQNGKHMITLDKKNMTVFCRSRLRYRKLPGRFYGNPEWMSKASFQLSMKITDTT